MAGTINPSYTFVRSLFQSFDEAKFPEATATVEGRNSIRPELLKQGLLRSGKEQRSKGEDRGDNSFSRPPFLLRPSKASHTPDSLPGKRAVGSNSVVGRRPPSGYCLGTAGVVRRRLIPV